MHPRAHTRVNMPACHCAQAHIQTHVSVHTLCACPMHAHTQAPHIPAHRYTPPHTCGHTLVHTPVRDMQHAAHTCTCAHTHAQPCTHTHRIPVFPRLGHFLPCLCVGLKFLEAGAPGRGHPTSDSQFVKQAGAGLCPFGSALCPLCDEVCVNTLAETGQNCANGSAPSGDSLGEALSKSVTRCNFRTTKIIKRKKKKTTSPRGHSTVLSTKLTASAVVGTGFWWGL